MNIPFFSVVIPTYNQAQFLKIGLNSVFKQTFKSYEIIVIDNYSNDNTSDIVKKNKKKIIYKKINNNGVIAKSRNLGIKLSRGKWIAFLDSDDYWDKNKLKKIYQLINRHSFKVICHSEWMLNSFYKKKKILTCGPYKKKFYQLLLKHGNRLATSATTVEKKFLHQNKILFNEKKSFITAEDYDFFLNIARKKVNFYFTNDPLGCHLFHKKSASSNLSRHFQSIKSVVKHHVFNVQDFSKNKKVLWKDIENFLDLKKSIINVKKVNRIKQSKEIISFLINRPLFTITYINTLLLKKIKNYLIYLFYKLKLTLSIN